jgi:hypothetical protein
MGPGQGFSSPALVLTASTTSAPASSTPIPAPPDDVPVILPSALGTADVDVARSNLRTALTATRSAVAAAQAHERATALTWEHERASVDALARQLAEAEILLGVSSPAVADADPTSESEASIVANLHAQAASVQNIRSLVPVFLDTTFSAYARWRDLVLFTLQHYALDDHVLTDRSSMALSWFRMDSFVLS